jgi:hypothetical protein
MVRGVFGGISLIPLFWTSFGGIKLGYGLLMRCSYYPKVLFKSVERFGRSRFGFGGVDPQVLFIPSCPGYTGLIGAFERSDRCNPRWVFARVNVWVCSLLFCVGAVSSLDQLGGRLACLVL